MAEFKLERFKYSWKGDWAGGTDYRRDDIVKVGGKSYVCLETHTADSDFNVDLNAIIPGSNPPQPAPRWKVMTDSRAFAGTWQTGTAYQLGDIVAYDGSLWICSTGHTSTAFENEADNWTIFVDGIKYKVDWQTGESYGRGAIVKYNGIVYRCVTPHFSGATLEANINDWEEFHNGIEFAGNWTDGVTYRKNDLVKYGGSIWMCITTHTAAGIFEEAFFVMEYPGFQYDGDWEPDTYYQIGDVVRYGGYLYYATNNSYNLDPFVPASDSSNYWTPLALTYNFRGTWSANSNYKPGDIIERGGELYLAKEEIGGFESDGSSLDYEDNKLWELLTVGQHWSKEKTDVLLGVTSGTEITYTVTVDNPQAGDLGNKYIIDGAYKPTLNMIEGYTYIFNQDHWTNVYWPNQIGAGENPHPLNFSADSLNGELDGGTAYINDVTYFLDDVIVTKDAYNTVDSFITATTRRVEIKVTSATPDLWYWCSRHTEMGSDIKTVPPTEETGTWQANREYKRGDIVYYFGTAYKCNYQHDSTLENFPGDNGNVYKYWDVLIESASEAGLSVKGDLLTFNLNRTLQGDGSSYGPTSVPIGEHEQLLSVTQEQDVFWRNYLDSANVIYVSQNGQDEVGYGTSHNKPFKTVKHACEYVLDNFNPMDPVKVAVATGRYVEAGPITVPAGTVVMGDELRSTVVQANTEGLPAYTGDDYLYKKICIDHILSFIDDLLNNREVIKTIGNNIVQDKSVTEAGVNPTQTFAELVVDHHEYIEYYIGSGTSQPTVISTSTETVDTDYINAVAIIENNKEFISEEVIAHLRDVYEEFSFEDARIRRDVYHFLRGIQKDLTLPGNFYTILHARDYKNRVLGSRFDDLFYMRDTTGLRNMTLEGLDGTLNPPGVFDLYQRPTGGSFVSLDPGYGPDDDSCWINNRSPYIQGVTNIGSNCVGQKVDGSVHNGGLKSMTSNDFTQVLSDGIGAWILNNARAELVSVFTYYCAIGYLADAGGVIRAANGNNSYGTYGAIADGLDETETPQDVKVFNRNQDASVKAVFAGEFTDQIFAFEFDHCGEEYTSASATVQGAGINADVEFDDFRDGAVTEVRLLNSNGSGSAGGVGYSNIIGNAQSGNTTQIQLESDSGFEEADVQGKRLIIVSGDGTGQYGIINTYSNVTKICTVLKEDGTAGWDHIVPGTPLSASLTTNTQYRIEPLVEFSAPGYSSTSANLPQQRTYIDVAYSDTTSEFTGLEMDFGSGDTVGVVSAKAVFNVLREGQTYTVTFTDTGNGYAIGDSKTIAGTLLGGSSPDNDLTITVTSVTDDSISAIQTYTVEGTGIAGKFVAIADPNYVSYSEDGENWTEGTLPFVGEWKRVIAGNNRFVAVSSNIDRAAVSLDGITWTLTTLPSSALWNDVAYGNGRFVIIGEDTNSVLYSTDGITWNTTSIPDDLIGDSTASQWVKITYGKGRFVAIAGNDTASAVSTDNGLTWTRYYNMPALDNVQYVGLEYGMNVFLAVSEAGDTVYSFDGEDWTEGNGMPSQDGSTVMNWNSLKYANGLFTATCNTTGLVVGADVQDGTSDFWAVSEDGISWEGKTLPSSQYWKNTTYAVLNDQGYYLLIAENATINAVAKVQTGKRARGRISLQSSTIDAIKIWDPGSGYLTPPTVTVTDTSQTVEVALQERIGNGVLSQPSWINRGTGYRSSSTTVSITGNGYADIFPINNIVTLSGVQVIPGPGAQIRFSTILNDLGTEEKLFTAVKITDQGDDGTGNNTRLVEFQISPYIEISDNLAHDTDATIRERYSQCRISGHDFLDIGTGNFEETNYPEVYAEGRYFTAAPENEVYEENGGRVFYVSTDQDGNFRAGELFSVQQATGIVTISADFFDLDGLSELALGGVTLGGSGAIVREFSKDPTFAEDSNNVVPTQRAITTFLANRLSVGGSDLEANEIIAGRVRFGGSNNEIDSTIGGDVKIPVKAIFEGPDVGIDGLMIMYPQFLRNYPESMQ